MNNEISIWNGYPVHGEIKELDRIIESEGLITLDKDDVVNVLSAEGESHVTSGVNSKLGEAFNEAVNALPCKVDKVEELLIDFRFGNRQPDMSEFSSITDSLSGANPDINIMWGITSDESLGDSYKVVLVASVKA
ncbi:cell division protein FtsZ [Muribaculaceae bacterium]|jgi:cell division protein FtsZ|nr:cell division protein FtsZ [Muribaculaceae bacterium]